MGSGCGSVGRVVNSDSRGPQFESSHWQKVILNIYCQLYWKGENKAKSGREWPFFKKTVQTDQCDQMIRLLFRNLAIYNKEICPKVSKFPQILNISTDTNWQGLLEFCQSGKISPNLVTLKLLPGMFQMRF